MSIFEWPLKTGFTVCFDFSHKPFICLFLSGRLRQFLLYISISVTNPLDVIKIRMQLEKEMVAQKGLSHMKGRYYNGLIKGCAKVIQDEGIRGLYKG